MWRFSRLRQCKYLNNIVEQDHRRTKRLARPGLGFGSLPTARRTLSGYEAMAMIRKGQVHTIDGHDIQAQTTFVASLFEIAAWQHPPPGLTRPAPAFATEPSDESPTRHLPLSRERRGDGGEFAPIFRFARLPWLFGPLLFPSARTLGINEIHYAMVVILAMGIGLFAPPFGVGCYAAFAIRRVSPDAAMRRSWPYPFAVLAGLIAVAAVPWFSVGFL